MQCSALKCNKFQLHGNAPILLPCPTRRHVGEPQYPKLKVTVPPPPPPGHCTRVGYHSSGRPHWVRFASPQLAPTAPASARSSLLSVQCSRMRFLCPLSESSMAGIGGQDPSSLLHGTRCRLLSLRMSKHSTRLTPFRPCQSASQAVPLPGEGHTCKSGVISGMPFACAGPSRPGCPLQVFGPWASGTQVFG